MQKRDWFEVGAQLIGVWQLVVSVEDLVAWVNVLLKNYRPAAANAGTFLTQGFTHLFIGLALIAVTGVVSNLAYGARSSEGSTSDVR